MPYTLNQLNAMAEADFVAAIGPAFEDTPAIAAQVWAQRPFISVVNLHQHMVTVVRTMPPADQLALINAHPALGTRITMAAASVAEQSKAGLDSLTNEEYHQFQALNQQYKNKFGFPFILAVAGQTKTSILKNFVERLRNSTDAEMLAALLEIEKIALSRLDSWIVSA